MEEKIFVGYNHGTFRAQDDTMREYCNAFMLEKFTGTPNDEYCFQGQKAVKYKCSSPAVFKDVPIGSTIECYFDSKGRISKLVAIS